MNKILVLPFVSLLVPGMTLASTVALDESFNVRLDSYNYAHPGPSRIYDYSTDSYILQAEFFETYGIGWYLGGLEVGGSREARLTVLSEDGSLDEDKITSIQFTVESCIACAQSWSNAYVPTGASLSASSDDGFDFKAGQFFGTYYDFFGSLSSTGLGSVYIGRETPFLGENSLYYSAVDAGLGNFKLPSGAYDEYFYFTTSREPFPPPSTVPLPASLPLSLLGLGVLLALARRKAAP